MIGFHILNTSFALLFLALPGEQLQELAAVTKLPFLDGLRRYAGI